MNLSQYANTVLFHNPLFEDKQQAQRSTYIVK